MAVGEKIIDKLQLRISKIITQSFLSRENQINQISQVMRDQVSDIPDYDIDDFNDRMSDFLSEINEDQSTSTDKQLLGIRQLLETFFLECSIELEDSEDDLCSSYSSMSR